MSAFIHPSILRLFLMQSLAHWRRFGRSFVTPRRFVLSSVGLLLGIFYLGNVVLSVCLREPMNDERFRAIVPFGLMAYVLWDLVKTACRRPEEGLGWSRAERERLSTVEDLVLLLKNLSPKDRAKLAGLLAGDSEPDA